MDEQTATWFQDVRKKYSLVDFSSAENKNALSNWFQHHTSEHKLHKFEEIIQAIQKYFSISHFLKSVPYLYRYLISDVSMDSQGTTIIENILQQESSLIKKQQIKGIGFRVVAKQE